MISSDHKETHLVAEVRDLVPMFETLIAAFGYDAVRDAWARASGDEPA